MPDVDPELWILVHGGVEAVLDSSLAYAPTGVLSYLTQHLMETDPAGTAQRVRRGPFTLDTWRRFVDAFPHEATIDEPELDEPLNWLRSIDPRDPAVQGAVVEALKVRSGDLYGGGTWIHATQILGHDSPLRRPQVPQEYDGQSPVPAPWSEIEAEALAARDQSALEGKVIRIHEAQRDGSDFFFDTPLRVRVLPTSPGDLKHWADDYFLDPYINFVAEEARDDVAVGDRLWGYHRSFHVPVFTHSLRLPDEAILTEPQVLRWLEALAEFQRNNA